MNKFLNFQPTEDQLLKLSLLKKDEETVIEEAGFKHNIKAVIFSSCIGCCLTRFSCLIRYEEDAMTEYTCLINNKANTNYNNVPDTTIVDSIQYILT